MAEQEQKDALDVMLDGSVKIGKYSVSRWTLANLVKLAPMFVSIRNACKEKSITADMFATDPLQAITSLAEFFPGVIAGTLDIEKTEAEGLDLEEAVSIMILIVHQNMSYLRKLFGPTSTVMSTLKLLRLEE